MPFEYPLAKFLWRNLPNFPRPPAIQFRQGITFLTVHYRGNQDGKALNNNVDNFYFSAGVWITKNVFILFIIKIRGYLSHGWVISHNIVGS